MGFQVQAPSQNRSTIAIFEQQNPNGLTNQISMSLTNTPTKLALRNFKDFSFSFYKFNDTEKKNIKLEHKFSRDFYMYFHFMYKFSHTNTNLKIDGQCVNQNNSMFFSVFRFLYE